MRLQNKTALITGAAAGIGAGVARRFAREGAQLWLCDINGAACSALAQELHERYGVAVQASACDVTERPVGAGLPAKSDSPIRRRNPPALFNALWRPHLELPAYQRAFFVDGAHHRVAIQRRAPAVIQAQHDLPTPIVGVDIALGHARVGDQHDFELAAAGRAGRAGDRRLGDLRVGDSFHAAQCKSVGRCCVKGRTDAQP